MASDTSLHVGIDENGLGPRLGPLVVTAVVARTAEGAKVSPTSSRRGGLAGRIGDSKKLVSFNDSELGEAWARALAQTACLAGADASPDALVHALSIDGASRLREPCPAAHGAQCWSTEGEKLSADDALVATLWKDLARLRARGLDVLGCHVAIVCTRRLNLDAERGLSRFQTDLHTMERLILHARERYASELQVTCGKVGGYHSYPDVFGPLAGRLVATIEEGRARSEYQLPGLGRVAFVRDADESHTLVGLASLVGKWVRDLLTRRVTRYHRAHDPSLPEASGYHDPVTTRFVNATALARKARGVPDDCFERGVRKTV